MQMGCQGGIKRKSDMKLGEDFVFPTDDESG